MFLVADSRCCCLCELTFLRLKYKKICGPEAWYLSCEPGRMILITRVRYVSLSINRTWSLHHSCALFHNQPCYLMHACTLINSNECCIIHSTGPLLVLMYDRELYAVYIPMILYTILYRKVYEIKMASLSLFNSCLVSVHWLMTSLTYRNLNDLFVCATTH